MNNFTEQNQNNNPNIIPSNRRRKFDNKPHKSKTWIPITIILGVIAVCFIGIFAVVGSFISMFDDAFSTGYYVPKEIKNNTILKLDFGSVSEISNDDNPFAIFSNKAPKPTFSELIKGIKEAADDPRIVGMYYDGSATISGTMANELKSAILDFKRAGKFMYSYLEAADKNMYSIALLSDSIFIAEAGIYEISGFGIGTLFMKGLYEKLGINYEVYQYEDYKSAAEQYKNYKFSDSARAAYMPYLKQRENVFIDAIAGFRDIAPSKVIALMDEGILTSDEMLEAGLADAISTKRQVIAMLNQKVINDSKGALDDAIETQNNANDMLKFGEIPTQRGEIPTQRGEIPTQRGEIPTQRGEIPTQRGEIPTQRGEIPTQRGEISNQKGEISTYHTELVSASPRSLLNAFNKYTGIPKQVRNDNVFARIYNVFARNNAENDDNNEDLAEDYQKITEDYQKLAEDFEKKYLVSISDYVRSEVDIAGCGCNASSESIAIIYGEGPIVSSKVENLFGGGDNQIVASDFVKLIEKAANNDKIKGIILRINSPGGSVIASEEIYQAVLTAREQKPVFASMSNTAASGGYYIAMACEKIICHPHTLTGSIGVVTAIPNFSGSLKKLGINVDTISTGVGNAFTLTPMLPYTQKDKKKLDKMCRNIYNSFVSKAANSRNMSFDLMRASAKGRIWTGEDAKARNLVDTLGNLDLAIAMMKEHLDDDDLGINIYPKREDSFARFMRLLTEGEMRFNVIDLGLGFALSDAIKEQISYLNILSVISEKERVLCALPYLVIVE
ncbi:MAG: signal peptide peptidase SppA [Bacteroidetes bacterium]|nr:signal peptide peptidase SppA [Bacteroidota bacterium]